MKCSKEIAKKVEKFQKAKTEAEKLHKEIKEYFEEELGGEGFGIPFITDNPKGNLQNDDEYCDQRCLGEDWFCGTYYHKIEGSRKYVGYTFDI